MDVFCCWDGDHIGRKVGMAVLADDVGGVRRVDQAINAGNELWRAFALRAGGTVIEIGGDEGRISIGASHLAEVREIARQYAETVGATVSVGVAMRMSESAKALLIAKVRGGNQIVIWEPDMQPEIDQMSAEPKSEKDKLSDEYLGKEEKKQPGVQAKDRHRGFTGQSLGSKVKGTQGDHEEGHEAAKEIQDASDSSPPPPEMTHADDDLESQLHDAAGAQSDKDADSDDADESHGDDVRKKLVAALQTVRQSMPQIQQIKQTAPEIYQALMALTTGLVELGREVAGPQTPSDAMIEKTEDLTKSIQPIEAGKRSIQGPGRLSFDYSHHLPAGAQQKGVKLSVTHVAAGPGQPARLVSEVHHGGERVGKVTGYLGGKIRKPDATATANTIEPHSELDARYRGQGIGQSMYEALYAHAKNKMGVDTVRGSVHSPDAHRLHSTLATKHGFTYSAAREPGVADENYPYSPYQYTIKDEMAMSEDDVMKAGNVYFEKSSGGAEAGRSHLDLPAGTVNDGKIKVSHSDGTSGWKQVRAGMISGQEPGVPLIGANSHPVSSRSPGSK